MKKVWILTVVSLIIISFVLSFSFIGCKSTESATTAAAQSSESGATSAETSKAAETTVAQGEKPELIFWQNEAGSGLSQWYKDVVADINANENFTVKIVENPATDMIDKLTAAGVSQSGFDFTWDWSGSFSTLARGMNGLYQPVNKLLSESVISSLTAGTVGANTDSEGNIWGVPFFLDAVTMAYNLKILKDAGVDTANLPKTYDEFVEVCQKVKDSGAIPSAFANKEGIMNEYWGEDMLQSYFDTVEEHKEFWNSGKYVDNPDMKDAVEKYKNLYDKGYLNPEGKTLDYASNFYSQFASGKVASIWFIHSLYVSTIKEGQIKDEDVGYQLLPSFGNGKLKDDVQSLGYLLCIAKWTKYPNECAKAISYFVSDKWQKKLVEYGTIPALATIKFDDMSTLTPNLKFIFDDAKGQFTESPYALLKSTNQYDALIRNLTPFLNGETDYKTFATAIEEATNE